MNIVQKRDVSIPKESEHIAVVALNIPTFWVIEQFLHSLTYPHARDIFSIYFRLKKLDKILSQDII